MDRELRVDSDLVPEIRADEGGPKKITGYAVKWGRLSQPIFGMFREKFEKGAFADTLARGADVYASFQHNVSETIGRTPKTLILEEDDVGLRYEIEPPSWFSKIESIERGDVRGSSFIFSLENGKEEWDNTNPKMPIRTIRSATLYEVSPVTNPAYPQSTAGVRSAEEYREIVALHDAPVVSDTDPGVIARELDIIEREVC